MPLTKFATGRHDSVFIELIMACNVASDSAVTEMFFYPNWGLISVPHFTV